MARVKQEGLGGKSTLNLWNTTIEDDLEERRSYIWISSLIIKITADWFYYTSGNCPALIYSHSSWQESQRATAALATETGGGLCGARERINVHILSGFSLFHSLASERAPRWHWLVKVPLLTTSQTELMISLSAEGSGKWWPSRDGQWECFTAIQCAGAVKCFTTALQT